MGLDLIQYGCMHQRWINRPFVLFPEELTEEESSYFRRFQFQAQGIEHGYDFMDLQGIEGVRGFAAVFMIGEMARKALGKLDCAIRKLDEIRSETQEDQREMKARLDLLIRRLQAYQCFIRNIQNACAFQELADRTNKEAHPEESLRWPTRSDHRAEEFQVITRDEIDNAYELARLCEGHMEELFVCAESDALEDIFTFSKNLPSQLIKKAEIMLNHMTDGGRVYETNNI